MNALDTNVWIYSHDTRDPQKQQIAQRTIVAARPFALLWQVGCEFVAASHKLLPLGFTRDQAWRALADMQTNAALILYPDATLWPETQSLQGRYSLSFWDALLVAGCIRRGVTTLYTENLGAPRTINGLFLINPFSVP